MTLDEAKKLLDAHNLRQAGRHEIEEAVNLLRSADDPALKNYIDDAEQYLRTRDEIELANTVDLSARADKQAASFRDAELEQIWDVVQIPEMTSDSLFNRVSDLARSEDEIKFVDDAKKQEHWNNLVRAAAARVVAENINNEDYYRLDEEGKQALFAKALSEQVNTGLVTAVVSSGMQELPNEITSVLNEGASSENKIAAPTEEEQVPDSAAQKSYSRKVAEAFRSAFADGAKAKQIEAAFRSHIQSLGAGKKIIVSSFQLLAEQADVQAELSKVRHELHQRFKKAGNTVSQSAKAAIVSVAKLEQKLNDKGQKLYGKMYGLAVGIKEFANGNPGKTLEIFGSLGIAGASIGMSAGAMGLMGDKVKDLVAGDVGAAVAAAMVIHSACKTAVYPIVTEWKALKAAEGPVKGLNGWRKRYVKAFQQAKQKDPDLWGHLATAGAACVAGSVAYATGGSGLLTKVAVSSTVAVGNYIMKQRDYNRTKKLYEQTGDEKYRKALYGDAKSEAIAEAKGFKKGLKKVMNFMSSKKNQKNIALVGAVGGIFGVGGKMLQELDAVNALSGSGSAEMLGKAQLNVVKLNQQQSASLFGQEGVTFSHQKIVDVPDSLLAKGDTTAIRTWAQQNNADLEMLMKKNPQLQNLYNVQENAPAGSKLASAKVHVGDDIQRSAPQNAAENEEGYWFDGSKRVPAAADKTDAYKALEKYNTEHGLANGSEGWLSTRTPEDIERMYTNLDNMSDADFQKYFGEMSVAEVIHKYNRLDAWTIRVKQGEGNTLIPLPNAKRWQMHEEMIMLKKIIECNETENVDAAKIQAALSHIDNKGDTDLFGARTGNRITGLNEIDCTEKTEGYGITGEVKSQPEPVKIPEPDPLPAPGEDVVINPYDGSFTPASDNFGTPAAYQPQVSQTTTYYPTVNMNHGAPIVPQKPGEGIFFFDKAGKEVAVNPQTDLKENGELTKAARQMIERVEVRRFNPETGKIQVEPDFGHEKDIQFGAVVKDAEVPYQAASVKEMSEAAKQLNLKPGSLSTAEVDGHQVSRVITKHGVVEMTVDDKNVRHYNLTDYKGNAANVPAESRQEAFNEASVLAKQAEAAAAQYHPASSEELKEISAQLKMKPGQVYAGEANQSKVLTEHGVVVREFDKEANQYRYQLFDFREARESANVPASAQQQAIASAKTAFAAAAQIQQSLQRGK